MTYSNASEVSNGFFALESPRDGRTFILEYAYLGRARKVKQQIHVLVEIADNGPGISPNIQPRIFEPFFTTKGVGVGTGLSLDISYGTVVKMHHGDISFFSKPGDTRSQVRLPINLS